MSICEIHLRTDRFGASFHNVITARCTPDKFYVVASLGAFLMSLGESVDFDITVV